MEYKVKKQKRLNQDLNMKIYEDHYNERVFVEFSSDDKKFVLQRSFQNNFFGQQECENFSKSLKNLQELKERLGYKTTVKV